MMTFRPTILDRHVLTFDVASVSEAFAEGGRFLRGANGRRAAEQRYELAPRNFHSITSSARASTVAGMSRPNAFAVLRCHQLVLCRRLHRQVARLLTFEDAVNVTSRAAERIDVIRPIGDQAASV